MDLGLDYFRVLWPLVCFKKGSANQDRAMAPVGVIGVSRQALSGFYKRLAGIGDAAAGPRTPAAS
jgi:hypothetical protein